MGQLSCAGEWSSPTVSGDVATRKERGSAKPLLWPNGTDTGRIVTDCASALSRQGSVQKHVSTERPLNGVLMQIGNACTELWQATALECLPGGVVARLVGRFRFLGQIASGAPACSNCGAWRYQRGLKFPPPVSGRSSPPARLVARQRNLARAFDRAHTRRGGCGRRHQSRTRRAAAGAIP